MPLSSSGSSPLRSSRGVAVAGIGVGVGDGVAVAVGGTGVSVGIGVAVAGGVAVAVGVAVGGSGVAVAGMAVAGIAVAVGGSGVGDASRAAAAGWLCSVAVGSRREAGGSPSSAVSLARTPETAVGLGTGRVWYCCAGLSGDGSSTPRTRAAGVSIASVRLAPKSTSRESLSVTEIAAASEPRISRGRSGDTPPPTCRPMTSKPARTNAELERIRISCYCLVKNTGRFRESPGQADAAAGHNWLEK